MPNEDCAHGKAVGHCGVCNRAWWDRHGASVRKSVVADSPVSPAPEPRTYREVKAERPWGYKGSMTHAQPDLL